MRTLSSSPCQLRLEVVLRYYSLSSYTKRVKEIENKFRALV